MRWYRLPTWSAVWTVIAFAAAAAAEPMPLVGYTEGRNDLEGGQFVNWVTKRACVVRADGTGRRVVAPELASTEHTWTQFAGWSLDCTTAIVQSSRETPENAAWERANRTFRMTEGWLTDCWLVYLDGGAVANLTAVERVSDYNSGLFYLPDGRGFGFMPLIEGVSRPYLMDADGRRKREASDAGGGFAYGYSASPDGGPAPGLPPRP